MRIQHIETMACDAGWRNYHFLKVVTESGIVGWAEYDEAYGTPGLTAVLERLAPRVIGKSAMNHEVIHSDLAAMLRPAPDGLSAEAQGAFENALLDAKGKHLGVPCYELLGGKHRDAVPVYWSHCATWRITQPAHYRSPITNLDGVIKAGKDARALGVSAVKTNLFHDIADNPRQCLTGFGNPYAPSLNFDKALFRSVNDHLMALREGLGPDIDILIDLNFNGRTESFVRMIEALKKFELLWIELDIYNPEALAYIRQRSHAPIASCETLFGMRQFLPYLQAQSMDVAIVDAVWNGTWQAMKIAALADTYDVNIAPHNFYSHHATAMNLHFAAAVPNLRVMETDIDRLSWDDELFTYVPQVVDGAIKVSDAPGWGCDPIEERLLAHPPQQKRLGF
jgi:galactonate dehydratase